MRGPRGSCVHGRPTAGRACHAMAPPAPDPARLRRRCRGTNSGVRRPWAIKPSSMPRRAALAPHALAAGCSSPWPGRTRTAVPSRTRRTTASPARLRRVQPSQSVRTLRHRKAIPRRSSARTADPAKSHGDLRGVPARHILPSTAEYRKVRPSPARQAVRGAPRPPRRSAGLRWSTAQRLCLARRRRSRRRR